SAEDRDDEEGHDRRGRPGGALPDRLGDLLPRPPPRGPSAPDTLASRHRAHSLHPDHVAGTDLARKQRGRERDDSPPLRGDDPPAAQAGDRRGLTPGAGRSNYLRGVSHLQAHSPSFPPRSTTILTNRP